MAGSANKDNSNKTASELRFLFFLTAGVVGGLVGGGYAGAALVNNTGAEKAWGFALFLILWVLSSCAGGLVGLGVNEMLARRRTNRINPQ